MKCPKCKQEIDDNSVFCDYCGEKVIQTSTEEQISGGSFPKSSTENKKNPKLALWISLAVVLVLVVVVGVYAAVVGLDTNSTSGMIMLESPEAPINERIISGDELNDLLDPTEEAAPVEAAK